MYALPSMFLQGKILLKHKEVCIEINGEQSIKMPEVGSKIEFKNYNKQMQAPFVIYADFEAITEPIHGCNQSNQLWRPLFFRRRARGNDDYKGQKSNIIRIGSVYFKSLTEIRRSPKGRKSTNIHTA